MSELPMIRTLKITLKILALGILLLSIGIYGCYWHAKSIISFYEGIERNELVSEVMLDSTNLDFVTVNRVYGETEFPFITLESSLFPKYLGCYLYFYDDKTTGGKECHHLGIFGLGTL